MAKGKKKSRKTIKKRIIRSIRPIKSAKKKKPRFPPKKKSMKGIRKKAPMKIMAKKKPVVAGRKEIRAKKPEIILKKIVALSPEEIRHIAEILSKPLVRQMLIDVGGENAIAIVKNFDTGMSDDDISKKLKLKISDVRAALNKLHNEGIVAYNREKDSETGWYSYSWYLNKERMERWAAQQVGRFGNHGRDGREYYVCPSCSGTTIHSFENALEKNFRCDVCNNQLEFVDEKRKEELGLSLQLKKG
ncbi:hypothetical protein H0O02_01705 [Candidatus Micrarchaeota archaeon]|nr:hypothetical protein [Candidatus Micrarchaeota archaeon]